MSEMPDTFCWDVVVAVIGALVTVGLGLVTFLVSRYISKTRLLNLLIVDINERRAFVVDPRKVRGARETNDFKWATESVLKCRDEIRRARNEYGFGKRVHGALDSMRRACNHYLEDSSRDSDSYPIHLARLRAELDANTDQLARRPFVRALKAGRASY
ncbi:MAG: hypothetical protein ABI566_07215 [Pseudolysinimonas sp.]